MAGVHPAKRLEGLVGAFGLGLRRPDKDQWQTRVECHYGGFRLHRTSDQPHTFQLGVE
jgi:hypothetical protein